jgi:hypothetical protein
LLFVLLGFKLSKLREFGAQILLKIETRGFDVALWLLDFFKLSSGKLLGEFFKSFFLLSLLPERKLILGNVLLEHDRNVFRSFVQTPQVFVIESLKEFIDLLDFQEVG